MSEAPFDNQRAMPEDSRLQAVLKGQWSSSRCGFLDHCCSSNSVPTIYSGMEIDSLLFCLVMACQMPDCEAAAYEHLF